MSKLPKNPFENYEEWTPWLEGDKLYWQAKQSGWRQYKQQYLKNNNNFFMSLKEKYINFAHLITKNAIVATVIMLIALTTVGASAAELFAPNEYKPSNLFSNKQETKTQITNFEECQKAGGQIMESYPEQCSLEGKTFTRELTEEEKNAQIQPLVADGEHDVVVIEECDLAIKYPKKINNLRTKIVDKTSEAPQEQRQIKNIMFFSDQELDIGIEPANSQFISCNNINFNQAVQNWEETNGFDNRILKVQNITKEKFCEQVKLNVNSCEKIENIKYYINKGIGFENQYFFSLNDKIYQLSTNSNSLFTKIQFNSLAPSTPSIKLTEEKAVQNNVKPLVADSEHDVVILEKYDIAIKYKKPTMDNRIIYIEPAGGGAMPGITFQYPDGSEKRFNFSYYCFSDIRKGGTFNDKPERTFQEYLNGVNDFEGKYTKLNTIPFFTSDSKEQIKEVYENNSPFGNKGQKKLLYLFSNNNYCALEIQHVNGQNLGLTETTLLKNVTLQLNSLAPSTPSVKLEQKPSFTGHGDINPITENPQTQTYTNEFYPDLNIKYDNSWAIKNETFPSQYTGLLSRQITLSKNGTDITFVISPKMKQFEPCLTSSAKDPSIAPVGKHYRYSAYQFIYWYQSYSQGGKCPNDYLLKSNLLSKNYKNAGYEYDEQFVESMVSVEVLHATNPERLAEAEEIIKNSVFSSNK
jgi:hypothetical protein